MDTLSLRPVQVFTFHELHLFLGCVSADLPASFTSARYLSIQPHKNPVGLFMASRFLKLKGSSNCFDYWLYPFNRGVHTRGTHRNISGKDD